ncbi:hypothetical protein BJF83_01890 [Nocardiopsis sp. CNR-923]|uniref:hypothetical protein n=1 Tax=Nocardiopsis sp. CNR-923 TaxID=1904965 RepID=UPI00095BC916|nr:hypothetical protein [Nocardiopsis sp. CNR-923]OLT28225.1 hypothetical protein BJF83_01890 [Nocardiopsis sp. CNR-923]
MAVGTFGPAPPDSREDAMHPDLHAQAADLYRAEREREARDARLARAARKAAKERAARKAAKERAARKAAKERAARKADADGGSNQEARPRGRRDTAPSQVEDGGGAFRLQA